MRRYGGWRRGAAGAAITVALLPFLIVATAAPATARPSYHDAVVAEDGTLLSGNGATWVGWYGPGRYEVEFDIPVDQCSYTASITDPSLASALRPGMVFVAGGHVNRNSVYVETKNPGGGLTDYPFHLQVACAGQGWWAVVDDQGNLARANGVSTAKRWDDGQYSITVPGAVAGCTAIATIGDTANGLVYSPSTIAAAQSQYDSTTFLVSTGRSSGNRPFHVQIQCPNRFTHDYVLVYRDGTVLASSPGVVAAGRTGTGLYVVILNRRVTGCAVVAGTHGIADLVQPDMVFATPMQNGFILVESTDIRLRTWDTTFALHIGPCATPT
jgi:hypothetical protein